MKKFGHELQSSFPNAFYNLIYSSTTNLFQQRFALANIFPASYNHVLILHFLKGDATFILQSDLYFVQVCWGKMLEALLR